MGTTAFRCSRAATWLHRHHIDVIGSLPVARLLIVHHTPSPHCQEMFESVVAGATDPEIEGVEVVRRPALTVSPVEMLSADGYVLGTPANLGYISGALKLAFDQSYYQLLDSTHGR